MVTVQGLKCENEKKNKSQLCHLNVSSHNVPLGTQVSIRLNCVETQPRLAVLKHGKIFLENKMS